MDFKCLVSVATALVLSTSVNAAIIVPQSISLSSGTKDNETPLEKLIDGSGLSDSSLTADLATVTHNSTDSNEARLFTSSSATVRLDLGGIFNIDEVFYWNTNTSAFNDVATINYIFLDTNLSSVFDSGDISIASPLNLTEMPSNLYDPGLISSTQFIDVTFTRRSNGSSFAPGEIRFTGEASVVPVPAAVWLFGSGLIGLIGIARRKSNSLA